VPTSVAIIATALTGRWHDERELIERAEAAGFLSAEGMSSQDGVRLLDELGLAAELAHGGTLVRLERALAAGHGVILAVDADEVWTLRDDDGPDDPGADHALVLAGVDRERGVVILCDPGNDQGCDYELPIDVFLEAWDDGGNEYVVVEAPGPSWLMWLIRLAP